MREALGARHALELGGRWRRVDPRYLGHVLELALLTLTQQGWPRTAVPAPQLAAQLRSEADIHPKCAVVPHPCSNRQHSIPPVCL